MLTAEQVFAIYEAAAGEQNAVKFSTDYARGAVAMFNEDTSNLFG